MEVLPFRNQKEYFDAQLFLKLPWQSQNLNRALSKLFKVNREVSYLETLRDIDSIEDVKTLFNFRSVYNNLFELFLIILLKKIKYFASLEVHFTFLFQSNFTNKGSPYFIIKFF
jgi:hypothetical protein